MKKMLVSGQKIISYKSNFTRKIDLGQSIHWREREGGKRERIKERERKRKMKKKRERADEWINSIYNILPVS